MTFAKPSNFWSKAVQVVAEAGRTGNLDELQVMDLKQVSFYKRAFLSFRVVKILHYRNCRNGRLSFWKTSKEIHLLRLEFRLKAKSSIP